MPAFLHILESLGVSVPDTRSRCGFLMLFLTGLVAALPTAHGAGTPPPLPWMASGPHRILTLAAHTGTNAGFSLLPSDTTGLHFTNRVHRERYLTNQIYLNGSGVAAGDVDGDGRCDLYFATIDGPNALYRNLGDWRFEEIATKAGVACEGIDASGVALADLDGDGDLDLIVNSVGQGTLIFLNDGKGRFSPAPTANRGAAGMSLAIADIDGDGDLDIYVTNYRSHSVRDEPTTRFEMGREGNAVRVNKVNGRPVTEPDLVGRFRASSDGKVIEDGEADVLLRNDGQGRFTAMSFTDGSFLDENGKALLQPPYDWGLSVGFRDLNGDGAPDLYVCNDFESPDHLWINDGTGRFRAAPALALRATSMFSMGVDFADINRDGLDDFFIADMQSRSHLNRHLRVADLPMSYSERDATLQRPQYSMNTLHLNRGGLSFSEVAFLGGVNASDWSWAPVFLDVDLDGYEDLLITTGHEMEMMNMDAIGEAERRKAQRNMSVRELLDLRRLFERMALPNVAFRNQGQLHFQDAGTAWGFNQVSVSHGMAAADLDNDGDMDLVVNNLNDGAFLLRNDAQAPRLGVRLKGQSGNTHGIGARIRVAGGPVDQSQEMMAGGRYLSSDDAQRTFAAGPTNAQLTVSVTWRSGQVTTVSNVAANRILEVHETSNDPAPKPKASPTAPMFSDVSTLIAHRHADDPFSDFQHQPLLPRRLSQLGPGVGWSDVDGDGFEDLIVGGGRGGLMAVWHNDQGKGFTSLTNAGLVRRLARDQTGIAAAGSTVFVGAANYEDGKTNGGCIRLYDLTRGVGGESVMGVHASTGPLALADVDGDGDLDLFIGGRCLAGRYPEAATSLLLKNEGGRFLPWHRFEHLGLVSGAVFTDLDGDGRPELALACDWGALRIFTQLATQPEEKSGTWGTEGLLGFWNGITAGDFDGDGRMDLAASNWGWNHEMQQHLAQGNRLISGEFAEDGVLNTIEAYYEPGLAKVVPYRSLIAISRSLPFLRESIQGFRHYGSSSVAEILGDRARLSRELAVTTFSSTVLLNRGGRFESRPLPMEAQVSPSFGITVADADGDGHEDLFLAQNFFGTHSDTPRLAGGLGVWLRGDGQGGFHAWTPQESGVILQGEGRGSAVGDYDRDGRVDLLVGQNSGTTRLFRNQSAKPGLRVRLQGPPGNPGVVGAVLRLEAKGRAGYAREIHTGAGYWSTDSALQILTLPEKPTRLLVRWPGGKTTGIDLPNTAREIKLNADGTFVVTP